MFKQLVISREYGLKIIDIDTKRKIPLTNLSSGEKEIIVLFYTLLFELLYKKAAMYKLGINHRQTSELICMTQGFREAILNEKIPEMKAEVSTAI